MIYALSPTGNKRLAAPGHAGYCPCCRQAVIAKCGDIKCWHWAHKVRDCDDWWEPESEWHLGWKRLVRPEYCEVTMGDHRADIITDKGLVVELQHSSISLPEALERERFYGNMMWVFDAEVFASNISFRSRGEYTSFRWKWARPTLARLNRPCFLDIGANILFHIKKMYLGPPCGGWGYAFTANQFKTRYLSSALLSRCDTDAHFNANEWQINHAPAKRSVYDIETELGILEAAARAGAP